MANFAGQTKLDTRPYQRRNAPPVKAVEINVERLLGPSNAQPSRRKYDAVYLKEGVLRQSPRSGQYGASRNSAYSHVVLPELRVEQ